MRHCWPTRGGRWTRREIAAIADTDARENWQLMIGFRDHLVAHPTLEAAYLALVRPGVGRTPPLFLNQAVHLILRNALDDCEDADALRAAELFFRPQLLTMHEGSLIAADEETIAGTDASTSRRWSHAGPAGGRPRSTCSSRTMRKTISSAATVSTWRSISPPAGAVGALARRSCAGSAICWRSRSRSSRWPRRSDVSFTWYVGLDAEGTAIGNALWNGEELDDATRGARRRPLPAHLPRSGPGADGQGRGGLSDPRHDARRALRMKPQNLVVGLPVTHLEAVS